MKMRWKIVLGLSLVVGLIWVSFGLRKDTSVSQRKVEIPVEIHRDVKQISEKLADIDKLKPPAINRQTALKESSAEVKASSKISGDLGFFIQSRQPEQKRVIFELAPEGIDFDKLRARGLVIKREYKNLLEVEGSAEDIVSIVEEFDEIIYARLPKKFFPLEVKSEGVQLSGAEAFHNSGYTGEGVKVAVIDVGFSGLSAAQANGDLPYDLVTQDFTGNGLQTQYRHGTACAEIVHDMAPQAELYLLKIIEDIDFNNALDYCIKEDIDIISFSLGTYDGPGDGTGEVCARVDQARAAGILPVVAAGNEATESSDGVTVGHHWQGPFYDANGDNIHEFIPGDADSILNVVAAMPGFDEEGIPETDEMYIVLRWNDWPNASVDYDLYLYDEQAQIISSSTGTQDGSQPPFEVILYDVPSSSTEGEFYYLSIQRKSGEPAGVEMELFATYLYPYYTASSSVFEPATAESTLAVGAISQTNWTTGPQEEFSSQGPTNAWAGSPARIKPDICGPDRVRNYTYESFLGTSAATAHVAGAAALLLSANPKLSADQLKTMLETQALDMGAPGKDNLYGWGRLNIAPPEPANEARDLAYQYLYEQMDKYHQGDRLRLIESYSMPYPPDQEDKAWIYDNALAIRALLIRRAGEDISRAKTLCQSLIWAQEHDPSQDGRLRDAYQASDLGLAAGRPNIAESSSSLGNLSWTILALMRYYRDIQDDDPVFLNQVLTLAQNLGAFIAKELTDPNNPGYFHHPGVHYKSSEQNIAAYAAFIWLYSATGEPLWQEYALSARRFTDSMWNDSAGHFWVGTTDDGATPNQLYGQQTVDVQAQGMLALGRLTGYSQAITWAGDNCSTSQDGFSGFDFNTDRDGIWFEGTAQMASAYDFFNQAARAQDYLSEIEAAQINAPNANGKGIVASSCDNLTTGFGWGYFPSPHIGATSWYLVAKQSGHPFWPEDTAEPEVTITSPAHNQTVNDLCLIAATVQDDFAVGQVEFYIDGLLKHTDFVEPYTFNWDTTAYLDSTHTIAVQVDDLLGNSTTVQITVIVDNQGGGGIEGPAPVTDFTAEPNSREPNMHLSWSEPTPRGDYVGVRIRRKVGSYPTSVTDGVQVVDSTRTSYYDQGLSEMTHYYYAAFSYDQERNYGRAAFAEAEIGKFTAPYLDLINPAADAIQVPCDTDILLHIKEDAAGVDQYTISLNVNGEDLNLINPHLTPEASRQDYAPYALKTGDLFDYTILYDPEQDFRNEEVVNVTVWAKGFKSGNKSLDYSYSFTTQMETIGPNLRVNGDQKMYRGFPCIVCDASGKKIFVTWEGEDYAGEDNAGGRGIYLAKSIDGGVSFQPEKRLFADDAPGTIKLAHSLARSPSGTIYLVWTQKVALDEYGLYFSKSEDEGESFSSPIRIEDQGVRYPSSPLAITAHGDKKVFIAWPGLSAGEEGIYFAQSQDGGATFNNSIRVDDGLGYPITSLAMDTDGNGDVYIAWAIMESSSPSQNPPGCLFFDKHRQQDATFAEDVLICRGNFINDIKLAVRPNGQDIYLAWGGEIDSDKEIFFAKSDNGGQSFEFNPDLKVTDDIGDYPQMDPDLKIDSRGDIYMVWRDKRNDPQQAFGGDIYLVESLDRGGSFKTNILLNDDAGSIYHQQPALCLDASGRRINACWADYRNYPDRSGADIYFTRNTNKTTHARAMVDMFQGGTVRAVGGGANINGATVIVPRLALECDTNITISEVENPPPLIAPPGRFVLGAPIAFGPGGTKFKQTATIRLPYTQEDLVKAGIDDSNYSLSIYYFDTFTDSWVEMPNCLTYPTYVETRVGHFSLFGIIGSIISGVTGGDDGGGVVGGVGGADSGGGGCFIATAAYGSSMTKEVAVLCEFRDRYLLPHTWGKRFVALYYKLSPPVADYIAEKQGLKAIVRGLLKPFIWLSKLVIEK